jgi:hypothetical protein
MSRDSLSLDFRIPLALSCLLLLCSVGYCATAALFLHSSVKNRQGVQIIIKNRKIYVGPMRVAICRRSHYTCMDVASAPRETRNGWTADANAVARKCHIRFSLSCLALEGDGIFETSPVIKSLLPCNSLEIRK